MQFCLLLWRSRDLSYWRPTFVYLCPLARFHLRWTFNADKHASLLHLMLIFCDHFDRAWWRMAGLAGSRRELRHSWLTIHWQLLYNSSLFCNVECNIHTSSIVYWQKCNKRAERTIKEKHCCQIAKIQQTHIKVQSHKATITKRNSN